MTRAHYEVRPEGEPPGEWISKTGSNTEAEYNRACRDARNASNAWPGKRYEVRYQGYDDLARDLLVAAYQDGEQLDIRTAEKRDEDLSR